MKIGKAILMWLVIIVVGSLISVTGSGSFNGNEDLIMVLVISLLLSIPSAILFIICIKSIAGNTKLGYVAENLMLLGIHFILTYLTFNVTGDINSSIDSAVHMMLTFMIVGAIVWTLSLFTSNGSNNSEASNIDQPEEDHF